MIGIILNTNGQTRILAISKCYELIFIICFHWQPLEIGLTVKCYSLHVHTWIFFETWHLLVYRFMKNDTPYFFDNGDVDHLIKLLIAPVTVLSPLPDRSFFVGTSRSLAVLLCLKLVDGFNSLSSLIITRKWILHKHILLSQSVSHCSRLKNLFLVAERKCNQNWQELALHKIHDTITSILNFNDIHLYVNLNLNGICHNHVYVRFTVINYLFLFFDIYETTNIFHLHM